MARKFLPPNSVTCTLMQDLAYIDQREVHAIRGAYVEICQYQKQGSNMDIRSSFWNSKNYMVELPQPCLGKP